MIAALGLLCLLLLHVSGQEKPRPDDRPPPRPVKPPPDPSTPERDPLPTDPLSRSRPTPRPTPTPTPTSTPPPIGCSTCRTAPLFDLSPTTGRFEVALKNWQKSEDARAIFLVKQSSDGTSTITAEFKGAAEAPEGTKYVVWAKSPDNEFIPMGEFKDPPSTVTFTRKLNLNRSGFFITLESSDKKIDFDSGTEQPSNLVVGVAQKPNN